MSERHPSEMQESAASVHTAVREAYTRRAEEAGCGCGAGAARTRAADVARSIGYSEEEIGAAPDGANLGLGCGNPNALAALEPGQVVLDLGSGAGFDCFLAARAVGPSGRVIGVDMTDAMLERARENARRTGVANAEFRKGLIEALPVADASVDVAISNCVINLSPDKPQVFREAYRVLRPGGRLAVSDIVLERPLPEAVRGSVEAYVGCVAGALLRQDYLAAIAKAGFREIRVVSAASYGALVEEQMPELVEQALALGLSRQEIADAASSVVSLKVTAVK